MGGRSRGSGNLVACVLFAVMGRRAWAGLVCRAGAQLEGTCSDLGTIASVCSAPYLRCDSGIFTSLRTNCSQTASSIKNCILDAVATNAATNQGLADRSNLFMFCDATRILVSAASDTALCSEFNYRWLGALRPVTTTTVTTTSTTTATTSTSTQTTRTLGSLASSGATFSARPFAWVVAALCFFTAVTIVHD